MPKLIHWTEKSVDDFLYKISADFAQQIENYLSASGENRKAFAERLDLTPGRVSQVLNNPGNFTLKKIIEYARAAGKKVAVVAYDDKDSENARGLVNSQVFEQCWIRAGRPADFFAMADTSMRFYRLQPEGTPWLPLPTDSFKAARGNDAILKQGVEKTEGTDAGKRIRGPQYAEV